MQTKWKRTILCTYIHSKESENIFENGIFFENYEKVTRFYDLKEPLLIRSDVRHLSCVDRKRDSTYYQWHRK